uniref:uncharacterized protein LOC120329893 n=1 Tax=Styela clava TaxID=7725 RepID=UPI00193A18C8|nr:uncharacterized protein LOC120329893 [Styela clava]
MKSAVISLQLLFAIALLGYYDVNGDSPIDVESEPDMVPPTPPTVATTPTPPKPPAPSTLKTAGEPSTTTEVCSDTPSFFDCICIEAGHAWNGTTCVNEEDEYEEPTNTSVCTMKSQTPEMREEIDGILKPIDARKSNDKSCDIIEWTPPFTELNEYSLFLHIIGDDSSLTANYTKSRMPVIEIFGIHLRNIQPSTCIILQMHKSSCLNINVDTCSKEIWLSDMGNNISPIKLKNFRNMTFQIKYSFIKCLEAAYPVPPCNDFVQKIYKEKETTVTSLAIVLVIVTFTLVCSLSKLLHGNKKSVVLAEDVQPADTEDLGHIYGWW